jgi:hypothetical protein
VAARIIIIVRILDTELRLRLRLWPRPPAVVIDSANIDGRVGEGT